MTKENPEQPLIDFAKTVKKQLKKAYNKSVRRLSYKIDLHGQPKAVLKIGSNDNIFELWFRKSDDGSIVIDKISDGKAVGTIKVNTPICHLRTSALLVDKFDLPDIVKTQEMVKESVEPGEEFEDFEEEFIAPSGKFAIVDASVIEGLDNELVEQAIMVPVKQRGTVFSITANYDDVVLRTLSITPSEYEEGNKTVTKITNVAVLPDKSVEEGIAPLSNDSSIERKIRKHTSIKQKHHMRNANDVPLRLPDVDRKVQVKRDKSDKDRRMKQRQAEDINKSREQIMMLLDDSHRAFDISKADLQFAKNVMEGLIKKDIFTNKAKYAKMVIEQAMFYSNSNYLKGTEDINDITEMVEWMQKNQKKT